jgi:hypothetical protein
MYFFLDYKYTTLTYIAMKRGKRKCKRENSTQYQIKNYSVRFLHEVVRYTEIRYDIPVSGKLQYTANFCLEVLEIATFTVAESSHNFFIHTSLFVYCEINCTASQNFDLNVLL